MTSNDDLNKAVDDFFTGDYVITNGTTVPDVEDIALGKVGREMELAMLFIDIKESTKIVDDFRRQTAAKMYKSFLHGITRIARDYSGYVRSFNGDGVLVVFDGGRKCNNAVKASMKMSYFCTEVLKSKVEAYLESHKVPADLNFGFGIGIHVGKVLIVRGGIRGDKNNDLVWVGNATNFAVKLSTLATSVYRIYISQKVYSFLDDDQKYKDSATNDENMWTKIDNSNYDFYLYKTNFHWGL